MTIVVNNVLNVLMCDCLRQQSPLSTVCLEKVDRYFQLPIDILLVNWTGFGGLAGPVLILEIVADKRAKRKAGMTCWVCKIDGKAICNKLLGLQAKTNPNTVTGLD